MEALNRVFTNFSEHDRRVLVFVKAYEDARRKQGQYGYHAFRCLTVEIVKKPVFKQFRTVVAWLDDHGWKITWRQLHWQGYIRFVFKTLSPKIPQPGQLKNPILLKKYLLSIPDKTVADAKTIEQLEQMYFRIIRPEIRKQAGLMHHLGLRGVELCPPQTNVP